MTKALSNVTSGNGFTRVDTGSPASWARHEFNMMGTPVGKAFLGGTLGLTGMEASVGMLPAGVSVPFHHAHKQNEELYVFVTGNGEMLIDDERFAVGAGTFVRVAPAAMRCLRAGTEPLAYMVIQAKAGSLEQATRDDGIRSEKPVTW